MDSASLDKAVELIQEKVDGMGSFGSRVRFDFGDGTGVLVDGNDAPPAVSADANGEADCTITAEPDVFQQLVDGDLDPTAAFMTGRIKIDGDMTAAMAMAKVLG